jgi:hypothetical protein
MALASSKKRVKDLLKKSKSSFSIDNTIPDFSKEPAFVAKHQEAERLLAECGFLKEHSKPKTKSRKKIKH